MTEGMDWYLGALKVRTFLGIHLMPMSQFLELQLIHSAPWQVLV